MSFIPPWRLSKRFDRWITYASYVVMLYAILTIFVSGLPSLLWLLLPWFAVILPWTAYSAWQLHREIKANEKEMAAIERIDDALRKSLAEGGTQAEMVDRLPPDVQEEMRMFVARKTLGEK